MNIIHADVLIIGSGLAGLMAAELLSFRNHVIIITKSRINHSNSMLAQGGIAAAIGKEDHWTDHFFDTVVAGEYHNAEEATKLLVKKGPEMVRKLMDMGVAFDQDSTGDFNLAREGGHYKRRILHAGGDATGREITSCLIDRIHNHTTVREGEMATDLIIDNGKCIGVYTKNEDGQITVYVAPHIILATGGVGGLYSVTSNDPSVTGDGMAMAFRAGAELSDMEFVQFHPTMLTINDEGKGLISEAVRGEGAILISGEGEKIMAGVHELEDLAPRDIVARQIHRFISNGKRVYLDIRPVKGFKERFPTITAICQGQNIDVNQGFIPVAPGAHFMMGGVVTDGYGRTSIPGLYAIGEVANTGVHGSNRLASNSLLEAIVFASQLARAINESVASRPFFTIKNNDVEERNDIRFPEKHQIQKMMTEYVGIMRVKAGLAKAEEWFEVYLKAFECKHVDINRLSISDIERLNMLTVGWMIASSALMRHESRGGHYRTDFPDTDNKWLKKRLVRRKREHEYDQAPPASAAIF